MGSISALFKSDGSGLVVGGFPRLFLAFLVALALAAPALAQQPGSAESAIEDPRGGVSTLPEVLDARVTATPERARLIIDLSGPAEFAIVSLSGPDRIAVDATLTIDTRDRLHLALTAVRRGAPATQAHRSRARRGQSH